MVGQYFLEKRFSRGYGGAAARQTPVAAAGVSLGPGGAK